MRVGRTSSASAPMAARPVAITRIATSTRWGGAGAAYRVSGDPVYLKALVGAYDYLQAHECFATGGFGPDELLLPSAELAAHLKGTHNSFETQCGSWAAFKMCKHLIALTGDALYGDWIERLAVNGIGASIPMTGDGRVFYYSDYNPGGAVKRNHETGWTCCAGTRPMAVADYDALVYFHDAGSLCVNLYTPSSVRWQDGGSTIELAQRTRFPRRYRSSARCQWLGMRQCASSRVGVNFKTSAIAFSKAA